jgi:cobalt-zinc-cadmium efflux system outer membrane protein
MILAFALFAMQAPHRTDSISLHDAIAEARGQRVQLLLAAAQVGEARGAFRTAGAIPNPTLSYSHSAAVPENHLLVDQSLDWLLRRASDRAAARAGIERARADSAATMIALEAQVRRAYWRARAAFLARELVAAQAEVADSLARMAAARLRAGDISLLEMEEAEQEAARAHQMASAAREAARIAATEFARDLGVETAPVPSDPLDAGLDQPPDSVRDPETLPALRASIADSEAAAALARSATRARLPFPTIQGGVEWGDPAQPGSLGLVGIGVPLPLWQSGGGAVAEAGARATRAAGLAREARLDALRDLHQSRIHLEETATRARVARDSLIPAAAVIRGRALRAYQAGETGILPVLDALRGERELSLTALQDVLAYQEAVTDWYALTGQPQ